MWGAGSYGRLGIGEPIDMPVPRLIPIFNDMQLKSLALGGFHSVCLTKPPKLYTWGMGNALGQFPEDDNGLLLQPRLVNSAEFQSSVAQIAAGTYHTLVLLEDGSLFVCGQGSNGRLGTGSSANKSYFSRLKFKGWVSKILSKKASSFEHAIEREAGGVGADDEGEKPNEQPWGVKQVGCGLMHTVVLTNEGSLYLPL
jgi:alpha-tubulin suppressor-like RCC1 family protein